MFLEKELNKLEKNLKNFQTNEYFLNVNKNSKICIPER